MIMWHRCTGNMPIWKAVKKITEQENCLQIEVLYYSFHLYCYRLQITIVFTDTCLKKRQTYHTRIQSLVRLIIKVVFLPNANYVRMSHLMSCDYFSLNLCYLLFTHVNQSMSKFLIFAYFITFTNTFVQIYNSAFVYKHFPPIPESQKFGLRNIIWKRICLNVKLGKNWSSLLPYWSNGK